MTSSVHVVTLYIEELALRRRGACQFDGVDVMQPLPSSSFFDDASNQFRRICSRDQTEVGLAWDGIGRDRTGWDERYAVTLHLFCCQCHLRLHFLVPKFMYACAVHAELNVARISLFC